MEELYAEGLAIHGGPRCTTPSGSGCGCAWGGGDPAHWPDKSPPRTPGARRVDECSYVTYASHMDLVFRALADRSRRRLLDRLFERDGQTLTESLPVKHLDPRGRGGS